MILVCKRLVIWVACWDRTNFSSILDVVDSNDIGL